MNSDTPQSLFCVSSSPHTHSGASVEHIMRDVLIALTPTLFAALYFFRMNALRLVLVCVGMSLLTEWLCRKAMKRENTLGDFSAAITGLLLAFNLPPTLPSWMAAIGAVVAIALAKQVFGGLGYNVFNPALVGRAFLLISFTGAMTTWLEPATVADATTGATPLGLFKAAAKEGASAFPVFDLSHVIQYTLGNMRGCIGETSALTIFIGGMYLIYRKVITWHIPGAYLASVTLFAAILRFVNPETAAPVAFHLLSGGLFLGAFFMATDMVTSPITRKGMLVFGVGCGLLTMIIRIVPGGAYPEGVSFAILIMNAFVPLINRACRRRIFGTGKPKPGKYV